MDTTTPTLETLFDQLGLPSDQDSIEAFVAKNGPLPEGVKLSEASFWSDSQARFLKEQLIEDDSWAPAVDDLNALLHQTN
jgi:hypothetical protein